MPNRYVGRNLLAMRNLPPVLGVQEVMTLLGKSQRHVLRLANSGELVGRKVGAGGKTSAWAFTGESVGAYLDRLDSKEAESA